jgi:hypothetical protein
VRPAGLSIQNSNDTIAVPQPTTPPYTPKLLSYASPNRNFGGFNVFNVDFKRLNCPSAGCVSAENAVSSGADIFNGCSVSVND